LNINALPFNIAQVELSDYTTRDWHHTAIASLLGLSSEQVLAAIQYINEHRDEVMAEYQRIWAKQQGALATGGDDERDIG
jgi:hypothetical protein